MELIINSRKNGRLVVLYDECDQHIIDGRHWFSMCMGGQGHLYACTAKKGNRLLLHNLIMGAKWIDHKNGDTLDNRRDNLRKCTPMQNTWNRRSFKGSSSKFKGVSAVRGRPQYKYAIMVNGVSYRGYGQNEIEAAKKYNELAIKYHGEFARLNQFT